MTPEEYCQDKAANSGSSFYYSFFFLSKPQRQAITALYAFCREVDDIVDSDMEPQLARTKLNWWRDEIDNLFQDKPQHPVSKALAPFIHSMNLPKDNFIDIIDGMEMDLDQARYESFDDLKLYCYRVASVVGFLSARIFGFKNEQTLEYANQLGLAFQVTNILRDVHEDAMRGRVYLPEEDLKKFNLTRDDILQFKNSEDFRKLIRFEAQRAYDYYRQAYNTLPQEDRYDQRCGLMMAAIYEKTLNEMDKDGFNVLTHRISLTAIHKVWLAIKTFIVEFFRKLLPGK